MGGISQAARGEGPRSRTADAPVKMMKDPICGTFVVPGKALSVTADGATVWFCSDEHVTFSTDAEAAAPLVPKVGDRVRVWPAHVDPTLAYHARLHLADGDAIVDAWEIDLRGW